MIRNILGHILDGLAYIFDPRPHGKRILLSLDAVPRWTGRRRRFARKIRTVSSRLLGRVGPS